MTLPFRPVPKPAPRLIDRVARQRAENAALRTSYRQVDVRDHFACRCCGRRLVKTLTLCPARAEHHHLVGRWIAPMLRADVRNIIAVDAECHGKLTRHELLVKAATFYRVDGRTYPNADGPLMFI